MHPHVCVGMANQPVIMLDAHAAQNYMIAWAEGMNVKPVAGANIHCASPARVLFFLRQSRDGTQSLAATA
ncbi:hypothetical protein Z946_4047 [Sulfitobacter noctilucicola]|nr:hypothetical protein Z946_4047 [Sulfitobacter noctilucicola]